MFCVLKKARIPILLRRKSNHIFTVWQHLVLLVVRQYENKSYRMFVEWLIEAYYLMDLKNIINFLDSLGKNLHDHYTTFRYICGGQL
jgi:hypothetical protein